jgi:hypothetical protein
MALPVSAELYLQEMNVNANELCKNCGESFSKTHVGKVQ